MQQNLIKPKNPSFSLSDCCSDLINKNIPLSTSSPEFIKKDEKNTSKLLNPLLTTTIPPTTTTTPTSCPRRHTVFSFFDRKR
ncbi:unnamed protein product [Meloidogyne enterolobii]|uniref:Uncharacterized protein n=1 Tax=Meloidogyne enterolobii TaxID=390850 RepID=A0ACB0YD26_MELEN